MKFTFESDLSSQFKFSRIGEEAGALLDERGYSNEFVDGNLIVTYRG